MTITAATSATVNHHGSAAEELKISGLHQRSIKTADESGRQPHLDEAPVVYQVAYSPKTIHYRDFYIWRPGKMVGAQQLSGAARRGTTGGRVNTFLHLFPKNNHDTSTGRNPAVRDEICGDLVKLERNSTAPHGRYQLLLISGCRTTDAPTSLTTALFTAWIVPLLRRSKAGPL